MNNAIFGMIRRRLRERSTWLGFVAVATALGVAWSPEQIEAIVAAGLAVWGVLEAFLPEPAGDMSLRSERLEIVEDAEAQALRIAQALREADGPTAPPGGDSRHGG